MNNDSMNIKDTVCGSVINNLSKNRGCFVKCRNSEAVVFMPKYTFPIGTIVYGSVIKKRVNDKCPIILLDSVMYDDIA